MNQIRFLMISATMLSVCETPYQRKIAIDEFTEFDQILMHSNVTYS